MQAILLRVLILCLLPAVLFAESETLAAVKKRGNLKCGVSQGLPGFSNPNDAGQWSGLDVDLCRAVAAAILDDAQKVEYVPLSAKERFTALQSGEVDVLARNTTWTMTRDTSLGLDFAGINYYDGQGFMVPKDLGINSAKELSGATICTNAGTTTELNLADYFRSNKLQYNLITFDNTNEVVAAYEARRCDAYTTDASGLAAIRLKLKDKDQHIILPEVISKEPLGPVVRQGDDIWGNIISWSLNAMINAEELGVDSSNIKQMLNSSSPNIQRLLGLQGGLGERLGLDDKWAYRIIEQVGNYAEVFERNLGKESLLNIDRGLNKLWTEGGLQYSPPMR